jgi:hypothetical protein
VVMRTEEEEDSAVTSVKMVPMSASKGLWVRKNNKMTKTVKVVRNVITETKEREIREERNKNVTIKKINHTVLPGQRERDRRS